MRMIIIKNVIKLKVKQELLELTDHPETGPPMG